MIKIYHNPRCRKSREGLEIVENSGSDFTVINYIKEPLGVSDIKQVLGLLKMKPLELVRKNESVWKEHYKDRDLSDDQIVEAMAKYPKLIERPIVVNGNKAVVGRPSTNIEELL